MAKAMSSLLGRLADVIAIMLRKGEEAGPYAPANRMK